MATARKGWWGRFGFVLVMTGLAAATLIGLAYAAGALRFTEDRYTIKAILPTVSTLIPGASVTMAGADVGEVTGVQRVGNGAEVTMAFSDSQVTPIPVNSRVQLAETTPIGENYVEIAPGNAREKLTSGAVLPMSQADQYVDVDQLLDVLRGDTTDRTRQLINGLGEAVDGRGADLNATLAGVNNTVQPIARIITVLKGQRAQAATLVRDLGSVAAAAGARGQSIIALADGARGTFQAVGAQDGSLSQILDELPGTLTQVRGSADALNSATNVAAPVLANLAQTVRNLKPAIQSLAPAASAGRRVVAELDLTAPGVSDTLRRVESLSPPLSRAIPPITQALCQFNPMLRYIKPYTGDINSFVSWFGSAVNAYDDIGHLVSLVPVVGDDSVNGEPPALSTATYNLLHAGLLENSTALSYDPYPAPGMIGKEAAGKNGYPNVIGPSDLKAATGYTYPHILTDCTA